MKPSILIIYTGGTIGMVKHPKSGTLIPFDFEHINDQVPELERFDFNIDSISFNSVIDSSDFKPSTWIDLVKIIQDNYSKYDGFVILHGTDTMAYTASALSFLLENINKPVILTGSQLPIAEIRTDAKEHLITAIEIAASKSNGKPIVPEVCIYFDYRLFRGNRTRKSSSSKFDAFESPNYSHLAEAGVKITYHHTYIQPHSDATFVSHTNLDLNVALLKLYPGITKEFVTSVINTNGLKALIIEAFGNGNAPTDDWFIDLLKQAIQSGIIILDISQCAGGMVELGRYQTSIRLKEIGVTGGMDMTTETALTKLMFLLAQNHSTETIKTLLQQSLRGEISTLPDS